ncbi:protein yellow-like [Ctenocephalides felis]|uniref:protein yellow-like n=1 Tax=Ctenocephalides felis TaxID=7515 RepID=UPI000E6E3D1A|nr:protein yellow-like [Ctenocephalides felis]
MALAILALIAIVPSVLSLQEVAPNLDTLFKWNFLEYNLPWDHVTMSKLKPENTVPTGLEVGWNRLFVATPRLRLGVGATLSTFPRNTPPGSSPVLQAYPDWSFHGAARDEFGNCTGLVSVYRIRLDSCNRLWVVDSGVTNSLDDFQRMCPPKILIFDTATDTVIRSVVFPREVLRPSSLLTNIILDETTSDPANHCDDLFAYISDTAAPGLIVYDAGRDLSWRVIHPSMYPDPNHASVEIQGESFSLMDGVVGLAFAPKSGTLYFQPLASDRLFAVPTAVLRSGPVPLGGELQVRLVGRKSSQGLGIAVDYDDDTVYFSTTTETSLALWNPHSNHQRLLAIDNSRLQFTADVRLPERDPGFLWALTTRFQKFFLRNVSAHETNLRIVRMPIKAIQSGPPIPQWSYLNTLDHYREKYLDKRDTNSTSRYL